MADRSTRQKLLRLMSDTAIHSGASLGKALGVSRTAVWKQIQSLETHGISIETIHGKGYRLNNPIETLDKERILSELSAVQQQSVTLEVFDQLESTNSHLMAQLKNDPPAPYVCLAEQQTAGRGRRGRQWVSPYATSLALSVLWKFNHSADRLAGLSLAIGVAITRVLKQLGIHDTQLKWPNDIVWRGRKTGGVLVEVSGDMAGPCYAVAGIGLNIATAASNESSGMQSIEQPWIDLNRLLPEGQNLSRNLLSGRLIAGLLNMMAEFEQQGFVPFYEEYKTYDALYGQAVVLQQGLQNIKGTAAGVGADGSLLLKNAQGIQAINSGEVTVRAVPEQ